MKILIILTLIIMIAGYVYLRVTSRRRFRKGGRLVMRKGLGDNPRTQRGNICLCPHRTGGKPCGKKAETGKLAERGLCRQCRMHGPLGKDRRDWDDI